MRRMRLRMRRMSRRLCIARCSSMPAVLMDLHEVCAMQGGARVCSKLGGGGGGRRG